MEPPSRTRGFNMLTLNQLFGAGILILIVGPIVAQATNLHPNFE